MCVKYNTTNISQWKCLDVLSVMLWVGFCYVGTDKGYKYTFNKNAHKLLWL